MPGFFLPVYDLINDGSLFGRGFAEINAGGFDTFVPHKVGEESNVVAALQEALCEPVTEGMRDRKSTRLNSSHRCTSRMPSSA